jgi:hypothetical protein
MVLDFLSLETFQRVILVSCDAGDLGDLRDIGAADKEREDVNAFSLPGPKCADSYISHRRFSLHDITSWAAR